MAGPGSHLSPIGSFRHYVALLSVRELCTTAYAVIWNLPPLRVVGLGGRLSPIGSFRHYVALLSVRELCTTAYAVS